MADENTNTPAEKSGLDIVQEAAQKIYDQGFVGEKVDPNPNEVYTVAGVTGQLKNTKKS